MDILFLHHNNPGQFQALVNALTVQGNRVIFVSQNPERISLPNLEHIYVPPTSTKSKLYSHLTSLSFRDACSNLKSTGFSPDLIFSHSGWGCSAFVKEVFPNSYLVSYFEWWFRRNKAIFDSSHFDQWYAPTSNFQDAAISKNYTTSLELLSADLIITPTQWQKSQLPIPLQQKTQVIHEGTPLIGDGTFHYFQRRRMSLKHITYATRGMEPVRGFPNFVKAIKGILKSRPDVDVSIAGSDKIAYGGHTLPDGFTSFGQWARHELSEFSERVNFLGHLSKEKYQKFLLYSDVHVYLTRPFVPSWSILDAMHMGGTIVSNKCDSLSEIIPTQGNFFSDSLNEKDVYCAISEAIERKSLQYNKNNIQKSMNFTKTFYIRSLSHLIPLNLTAWTKL